MLNLHLYTALVVGVFLVILGVTGSIIVFEPELDHMLNPALFHVDPGAQAVPVQEVVNALRAAYPHERIRILQLPAAPDESYAMLFKGKQVFVNGYTGRVIGSRSTPTLLSDIHQMHMRLLLPREAGGDIVSAVTVVLVWLLISGVYLWWPLKRVTVKRGASLRRQVFDLHNTAGIYTAVFLLVLAVTGVVVHFDGPVASTLNARAHAHAPVFAEPSTPKKGLTPIPVDAAIAVARAAVPGTTPSFVQFPAGPKGSYRVMMHFPEDRTGTRSWAVVDQYDGRVLYAENSRTAPPGTMAITLNRSIHTGQIYGYLTKWLMCISSLMLVVQVITGYFLWWKKLRTPVRQRSRLENVTQVTA